MVWESKMRYSLGSVLGVPLNMEILLLAIIGIVYTSLDMSIFELHSNLREVTSDEIIYSIISIYSQIYKPIFYLT